MPSGPETRTGSLGGHAPITETRATSGHGAPISFAGPLARLWHRLIGIWALATATTLLAAAMLLTVRHLSSHLKPTLSEAALLAITMIIGAIVLAIDSASPNPRGLAPWLARLGMGGVVLVLADLCRPNTSLTPMTLVMLSIILIPIIRSMLETFRPTTHMLSVVARPPVSNEDDPGWAQSVDRSPFSDRHQRLVQWSERYAATADHDGGSLVRGSIVVRFCEGSRVATGHIAFCPPLTRSPRVELSTPSDDLEVTLSTTDIQPWGMRIECRLETPSPEAVDLAVHWKAVA